MIKKAIQLGNNQLVMHSAKFYNQEALSELLKEAIRCHNLFAINLFIKLGAKINKIHVLDAISSGEDVCLILLKNNAYVGDFLFYKDTLNITFPATVDNYITNELNKYKPLKKRKVVFT